MEMPKTRKESFCKVFCLTKEFNKNVLPTKADFMKHLFCRLVLKENANGSIYQRDLYLIKKFKSIKKDLLKLQDKATMFTRQGDHV